MEKKSFSPVYNPYNDNASRMINALGDLFKPTFCSSGDWMGIVHQTAGKCMAMG